MRGRDETVSVVMPAYNAEATIREAIESVLAQTHANLELVVCDDASSDGTADIVSSFDDNRIRLIRNAANLGKGPSRDASILASRGTWIAVLDADDAWRPNRIETLLDATGGHHDVMVFDDVTECLTTPAGLLPWQRIHGPHAFHARGAPTDVPPSSWARSPRLLIKPLIPASTIRLHGLRHTDRAFAEDTEYFLRVLATGTCLRYVPDGLYHYRKSPHSASSIDTRHEHMKAVLQTAMKWFEGSPDMTEALRERLAHEDRLARYFHFLRSAQRGALTDAMRRAAAEPALLIELGRRTHQQLRAGLWRYWNLFRGTKR